MFLCDTFVFSAEVKFIISQEIHFPALPDSLLSGHISDLRSEGALLEVSPGKTAPAK